MRGEILRPQIIACEVAPQLLVAEDLNLLEKVLRGEENVTALAKLVRRRIADEERELPALNLSLALKYVEKREGEARSYLVKAKKVGEAWLKLAYEDLMRSLRESIRAAHGKCGS